MITRDNLADMIKLISDKDIKRINNTSKEFVLLVPHVFNIGTTIQVILTDNPDFYKKYNSTGPALFYSEDAINLINSHK